MKQPNSKDEAPPAVVITEEPATPPRMVGAESMCNRFTGRCLKCGAVATVYSSSWACGVCQASGQLV